MQFFSSDSWIYIENEDEVLGEYANLLLGISRLTQQLFAFFRS